MRLYHCMLAANPYIQERIQPLRKSAGTGPIFSRLPHSTGYSRRCMVPIPRPIRHGTYPWASSHPPGTVDRSPPLCLPGLVSVHYRYGQGCFSPLLSALYLAESGQGTNHAFLVFMPAADTKVCTTKEAPPDRLELSTNGLTVRCSTTLS